MTNRENQRRDRIGLVLCYIIALYFLVGVGFALLNYTDFASENPQFLRYVAIPGAIGLAFLAIGTFSKRRSLSFGLFGIGILAGLFLFEALMTYRQIPVWLGMLGKLSSSQQAADDGADLVRGLTVTALNTLIKTDEMREAVLSGFPNSEVILCTPGDQVLTYKADRYGFNNPDDIYERPIEVVLLGDSFVEGLCLPPGDDLASQVRRRGVTAAGLGIRGNGPLTEIASLGRFGPLLRPRHVVLAFFEGNDWENLQSGLRVPWLRSALSENVDFGSQEAVKPTFERAKTAWEEATSQPITLADLLTKRSTLRNFLALQQVGSMLGLTYSKILHDIPEFRTTLDRAKEIAGSWNGGVSILYIPQVDRFIGIFSVDAALDKRRRLVSEAAAAQQIGFIDLTEAFERRPDPMRMYGHDSHLSREGAAVAADVLTRALGRELAGAPNPRINN